MDELIVWSDEIAGILGLDVKTLYDHRWKERTDCPVRKFGKRLGAFRKDFDPWLSRYGALVTA